MIKRQFTIGNSINCHKITLKIIHAYKSEFYIDKKLIKGFSNLNIRDGYLELIFPIKNEKIEDLTIVTGIK